MKYLLLILLICSCTERTGYRADKMVINSIDVSTIKGMAYYHVKMLSSENRSLDGFWFSDSTDKFSVGDTLKFYKDAK